jgi:hypothetical protein
MATEKQNKDDPLSFPYFMSGERRLHVHGPGEAGEKVTFQWAGGFDSGLPF